MAKVESKTRVTMNIEVINSNNEKKGEFYLTTGNIEFYRRNAKTLTKNYTYQQLIDLIEKDIKND